MSTKYPPKHILNWLSVDRTIDRPLYSQISDQLRSAILNGNLAPGTFLPASRSLSADLRVSRNTALQTYDQLTAEGFLEAIRGSGTRVAAALADRPADTLAEIGSLLQREATPSDRRTAEPYGDELTVVAFQPGIPGYDAFPRPLWGRLLKRQAGRSDQFLHDYSHMGGYAPLRLELAKYLNGSRGVDCEPNQIIVTTSTRAATETIARTLWPSGAHVAVEDPGYLSTKRVLTSLGCQIRPVPVDNHGIMVDQIISGHPQPVGAYLTPAHQWPTGVTLSAERRIKLLNWAKTTGAWLLEDDYGSEFRFDGPPIATLQSYGSGRVIYIGTFSKTLIPSIRTAYFVVPLDLAEHFENEVFRHGVEPALHIQAALADFIAEGHFSRHIARMRKLYSQRRSLLVHALTETFGDSLTLDCPVGGLQITAHLPENVSATEVARLAAKADLFARPMSAYEDVCIAPNALHLGFAAVANDDILPQVQRLYAAVSRCFESGS